MLTTEPEASGSASIRDGGNIRPDGGDDGGDAVRSLSRTLMLLCVLSSSPILTTPQTPPLDASHLRRVHHAVVSGNLAQARGGACRVFEQPPCRFRERLAGWTRALTFTSSGTRGGGGRERTSRRGLGVSVRTKFAQRSGLTTGSFRNVVGVAGSSTHPMNTTLRRANVHFGSAPRLAFTTDLSGRHMPATTASLCMLLSSSLRLPWSVGTA